MRLSGRKASRFTRSWAPPQHIVLFSLLGLNAAAFIIQLVLTSWNREFVLEYLGLSDRGIRSLRHHSARAGNDNSASVHGAGAIEDAPRRPDRTSRCHCSPAFRSHRQCRPQCLSRRCSRGLVLCASSRIWSHFASSAPP